MPVASINGISTYYTIDGEGPRTFMLFNGANLTTSAWDYLMPGLAKLGRVVRFDARGLGQSEAVTQPYTLETLAEDTLALMDHLHISQAIILAHAFGGRVAQVFTRDHAERVRALILCGTGGLYPPLPPPPTTRPLTDPEGRIELWMATYFGAEFRSRHPERASKIIERFRTQVARMGPGGPAARQQLLQSEPAESYWGKAPASLPVLLLYGTEDRFGNEKNARDLAERFKNSKLVFIPGAGHMAIQEEPERIATEIAVFIKEHGL